MSPLLCQLSYGPVSGTATADILPCWEDFESLPAGRRRYGFCWRDAGVTASAGGMPALLRIVLDGELEAGAVVVVGPDLSTVELHDFLGSRELQTKQNSTGQH